MLQFSNNLILFQRYLVCLIPIALLTGPAIPDVLLSLAVCLFMYQVIKNKEFEYLNNSFFYIFIIFYLYIIFNSLVSKFPLFSLESSLFYFRFGLFSLAICYLLNKCKNFKKEFFYYLLLAFVIAILHGFYQSYYDVTIFGNNSQFPGRLLLLFSDQLLLGQFMARLFPLLVALAIYKGRENFYFYCFIFSLFIFIDILIFLSGERTAFGLLIINSIYILVLVRKFKIFRLVTLSVSLIAIVLITLFQPTIKERNIDATLDQIGISNEEEDINIYSPVYESTILTAYNMFSDNMFLGIGPNNFRNHCNEENYKIDMHSCSTHPHHSLIQIMAETGLIGLLFFLAVALIIFILTFKHIYFYFHKKNFYLSDYQICLLSTLVCIFLPILPSLNIFNGWINIVYYLPVGFLLHSFYWGSNVES